jgi:DNA polymerase-3 subunit epsilon
VHDALGDALACAELYLAQVAELGDGRSLTLGDVRLRHGSSLRSTWRRLTRALRRGAV